MTRPIPLFAAAAAAAVTLAGCALPGRGDPDPLVVGVDLSTGDYADLDAVYRQAIELRAEQVNADRADDGLPLVELRWAGNHGDPEVAAANVTDLAADPAVVAVVGGGCTGCAVAAGEAAAAARVPYVSLAAGAQVAEPAAERRWVFQLAPVAAGSADLLAEQLAARRTGTAAVWVADNPHGADAEAELPPALAAQGIGTALVETLPDNPGNPDDAGQLAGLARQVVDWAPAADPATGLLPDPLPELEAVLLWAGPAQAQAAAVALRAAGYRGQLWLDAAAAGTVTPGSDEAAGLDGALLLATETLAADRLIASLPHRTARQLWFGDYLSVFGVYDAAASYAADALDTVVAAADRLGAGRQPIRDGIETLTLPGLTGGIRFSPGNHSGYDPRLLQVLRFDGGRWSPAT